jgi:hypothetical protein
MTFLIARMRQIMMAPIKITDTSSSGCQEKTRRRDLGMRFPFHHRVTGSNRLLSHPCHMAKSLRRKLRRPHEES